MSILTKNEILKEIEDGNIVIIPFNKDNVGPASIDLRLGNEFRVFKKGKPIVVEESTDHKAYTRFVKAEQITLKSGEFVHGITEERIKLPDNICGFLYGRSRFARLGIQVHATASFIQPGIDNKQVLEIKNISPRSLVLRHGLKICQLILMDMKGRARYEGRFKIQENL